MKITRRFHSCVEIEKDGTRLIIDPGSFQAPDNLADVDAVLITHIHPDHVDADAVMAAKQRNPRLSVYAPAEFDATANIDFHPIADGDSFTVGDLEIAVHESRHGAITDFIEVPENLGYLIDDRVLHTGDSFPELAGVEVALVPVSAPWLKMLDVEAYLRANRPARFIGVHDGIDNEFGLNLRAGLLEQIAEHYGLEYLALQPEGTVEV